MSTKEIHFPVEREGYIFKKSEDDGLGIQFDISANLRGRIVPHILLDPEIHTTFTEGQRVRAVIIPNGTAEKFVIRHLELKPKK